MIPVSIREAPGSRMSSRGRNPEDSYQFIVTGVTSEWLARSMVDAATPMTLGSEPVWKQEVTVQERRNIFGVWDGVVRYGPVKLPDAGDWTWGFDSTVETQHVTNAREHIADYAKAGVTPKNHNGMIGVSLDGSVEGVDVYFPKFEWWEKHIIAYSGAAAMWALSTTLASCGGCTNSGYFRGFEAQRVLFLGGSGERSNTRPGLFELNVRFRAEVDRTGLQVGDISGIAKKAWEYLWIESQPSNDVASAGVVQMPLGAHVERMYDSVDFSELGINTGPPTY